MHAVLERDQVDWEKVKSVCIQDIIAASAQRIKICHVPDSLREHRQTGVSSLEHISTRGKTNEHKGAGSTAEEVEHRSCSPHPVPTYNRLKFTCS